MKNAVSILLLCLASPLAFCASAQPSLPSRAVLTLDAARALVRSAEQKASELKTPGVIVVVDDSGYPLLSERMDGAFPASSAIAASKARSAVMFRAPTSNLESMVNNGRAAALSAGFSMMGGGQPISVDGQVIGAIGVSTVRAANDDVVAQAALASLQ